MPWECLFLDNYLPCFPWQAWIRHFQDNSVHSPTQGTQGTRRSLHEQLIFSEQQHQQWAEQPTGSGSTVVQAPSRPQGLTRVLDMWGEPTFVDQSSQRGPAAPQGVSIEMKDKQPDPLLGVGHHFTSDAPLVKSRV